MRSARRDDPGKARMPWPTNSPSREKDGRELTIFFTCKIFSHVDPSEYAKTLKTQTKASTFAQTDSHIIDFEWTFCLAIGLVAEQDSTCEPFGGDQIWKLQFY